MKTVLISLCIFTLVGCSSNWAYRDAKNSSDAFFLGCDVNKTIKVNRVDLEDKQSLSIVCYKDTK